MDRYKFRGRRLDNGEWVYGNYQAGKGIQPHVISWWVVHQFEGDVSDEIVVAEVDPATVGQYTGLKYHTQRKESYEGDIVEYAGRLCIVKWDSQDAEYYLDSIENTHDQYSAECINDSTYKGNIHDNPELLEG